MKKVSVLKNSEKGEIKILNPDNVIMVVSKLNRNLCISNFKVQLEIKTVSMQIKQIYELYLYQFQMTANRKINLK